MNMEIPIPEIDVNEANERVQAGATFIDVREEDEYQAARIPGATLMPLSTFSERYHDLPRERQVVVHCRSGARSGRVTRFLIEQGYDAVNVAGGILAWGEADLPLEEG